MKESKEGKSTEEEKDIKDDEQVARAYQESLNADSKPASSPDICRPCNPSLKGQESSAVPAPVPIANGKKKQVQSDKTQCEQPKSKTSRLVPFS